MPMHSPEHHIQKACIQWFKLQYPGHIIYAIPNGGGRSKAQAGMLKAEGVLAGIPDLCIPIPNAAHCGMYIEVKTPTGRLSPEQKNMLELLRRAGNCTVMVRSVDQFMVAVKLYMSTVTVLPV